MLTLLITHQLACLFGCFILVFGQVSTQQPSWLPDDASESSIYKSRTTNDCACEADYIGDWNKWSTCTKSTSHMCHKALRYRLRPCSRNDSSCNREVWQYCLDESSCKGTWVQWEENVAECSSSCGEGRKARISLCRMNDNIGLFCPEHAPYKLTYETCNIQPCPRSNMTSEYTATSDQTNRNQQTHSDDEDDFTPNLVTWVAVAFAAFFALVSASACCCLHAIKHQTSLSSVFRLSAHKPSAAASPRSRPPRRHTSSAQQRPLPATAELDQTRVKAVMVGRSSSSVASPRPPRPPVSRYYSLTPDMAEDNGHVTTGSNHVMNHATSVGLVVDDRVFLDDRHYRPDSHMYAEI